MSQNKVTVRYVRKSPEETERRREELIRILAKLLLDMYVKERGLKWDSKILLE